MIMANRSNRNRKARRKRQGTRSHDAVQRIQELRRSSASGSHPDGKERERKNWNKHKGEKFKDVE